MLAPVVSFAAKKFVKKAIVEGIIVGGVSMATCEAVKYCKKNKNEFLKDKRKFIADRIYPEGNKNIDEGLEKEIEEEIFNEELAEA